MTQAPLPQKNRKKEDGRPRGTYKKFLFEETRLGFFLKYETPVVYGVILKLTPPEVKHEPPLLLIRIVCNQSGDPALKKAKFFRYLEQYAVWGLYCKRPKRLTPKREQYYEGIRKRQTEKFIRENRMQIEEMRKNNRYSV